jgi:hypothetical protein
MFDEIRSALQDVAGGAEKLRNVLSLPDASFDQVVAFCV